MLPILARAVGFHTHTARSPKSWEDWQASFYLFGFIIATGICWLIVGLILDKWKKRSGRRNTTGNKPETSQSPSTKQPFREHAPPPGLKKTGKTQEHADKL